MSISVAEPISGDLQAKMSLISTFIHMITESSSNAVLIWVTILDQYVITAQHLTVSFIT